MLDTPEIEWRYRENQDSEFAEAEIADLQVLAQDCDGDFSYWHVKRGETFLAAGEIRWSGELYHFDVAMERTVEVAKAILQAERHNSMRDCQPCNGEPGNERCSKCHGFGFYFADRPVTDPTDGGGNE
jgi:DnaJ-class molecular chaperone